MITIFSIPRPFKGIFNDLQRNAIKSWVVLKPSCQIILFEDEEGTTKKVAEEFGLGYISDAERNEFGSLLLDSVYSKALEKSENEILAQVTSDIILKEDFIKSIKKVEKEFEGRIFYMAGRRWDVDMKEKIDFQNEKWEEDIDKSVKDRGELHGLAGMDYRVFPKNSQLDVIPLIVGRPGDDSWLVYRAKSKGIPVIDATPAVKAIHQNHGQPFKKQNYFMTETKRNIKLAGGYINMMTLREADWILTENGFKRPSFPRIIFLILALFYPWRLILSTKRRLYNIFYGYK